MPAPAYSEPPGFPENLAETAEGDLARQGSAVAPPDWTHAPGASNDEADPGDLGLQGLTLASDTSLTHDHTLQPLEGDDLGGSASQNTPATSSIDFSRNRYRRNDISEDDGGDLGNRHRR